MRRRFLLAMLQLADADRFKRITAVFAHHSRYTHSPAGLLSACFCMAVQIDACFGDAACFDCLANPDTTAFDDYDYENDCNVASYRTVLGTSYMATAACQTQAATVDSLVDVVLDCQALQITPACKRGHRNAMLHRGEPFTCAPLDHAVRAARL
jgi:hypothetical protein